MHIRVADSAPDKTQAVHSDGRLRRLRVDNIPGMPVLSGKYGVKIV